MYTASEEIKAIDIPIDKIYVDDEFNCRGTFSKFDVIDLAKDIEDRGLLQPVVVVPFNEMDYEFKLIAGFRRLAACQSIKRAKIPAVIKENITELEARTINFVENLKRKDLNILQEAIGIKNLVEAGLRQNEIADRIGMSTGWVTPRLKLLTLPEAVQKEAAAGFLTAQNIIDLSRMTTFDEIFAAVRDVKEARLRGEKRQINLIEKKVKEKPENKRKIRNVTELFALQTVIREALGNGLPTRAIAWAAGEIDDYEIYKSIKEEADRKGIIYEIPEEYKNEPA